MGGLSLRMGVANGNSFFMGLTTGRFNKKQFKNELLCYKYVFEGTRINRVPSQ